MSRRPIRFLQNSPYVVSCFNGNSRTAVIITKRGTHGLVRLPRNTPVRNIPRFASNCATNGSQQCAKTTVTHAVMRNASIHPIFSLSMLFFIAFIMLSVYFGQTHRSAQNSCCVLFVSALIGICGVFCVGGLTPPLQIFTSPKPYVHQ